MKSKKIAYLASEFPGISHTFIFREIQALKTQGFTVVTASIRKPDYLDKMTSMEKDLSSNTCYIKATNPLMVLRIHIALLLKSPLRYLRFLFKSFKITKKGRIPILKTIAYIGEAGVLAHWMRKNKVNHIHVHFANPAATVTMLATLLGSFYYSLSIHGPDIFYNVSPNLLEEKIRSSYSVRCISHYCKSQLERLVPYEMWNKFVIVRCGVNLQKFSPRKEPNNEIPEILCLGRLVPAKGQHILLEASEILKENGIRFHLTFVGDGVDRNSLKNLSRDLNLGDSVSFVGAVGQDQVHRYYDMTDIFVLPSFAEGVPVVLMEAMAKEIPVISTRITGIPELIEHNKDGLLTSPSDVKELAYQLKKLIENKKLRQELGSNGRKKVQALYDLNNNCKLMADFFKDNL